MVRMIEKHSRWVTLAVMFAVAFAIIFIGIFQDAFGGITKDLLIRASYLYLNNDLNNEAAAIYVYDAAGDYWIIRANFAEDYFDISVDNGQTWHELTTEDTDSGEANTASNQGGGIGLFLEKLGVDLELASLESLHAGVGIYLVGDKIQFNIHPGAIVHNDLQGLGVGDPHTQYATDGELSSHTGDTNNPHSTTKTHVGLGNVENLKVKLDATSAPTVNNDVDEGYAVGSRWEDITNDKEYVCLDNTDGAAVWTETTQSGAAQLSDLSDVGVTTPTNRNALLADGDSWESRAVVEADISDLDHTDTDAFHDDEVGEINALSAKSPLVDDDVVVIEDSAASYAKKKTLLSTILTYILANDLHNAWMITDIYMKEGTHPTDNQVPTYDVGTNRIVWEAPPGLGGGEANTGSNQGTDGVGVYDTKSGIDLQFRHVAPGSAKVTTTLNGKDIDIDLDLSQAWDFTGDLGLPYITTGDTTVAEGDIRQKSHEDAIAFHGGSSGEVQDEALISIQDPVAVHCDPGALYDNSTDWRFFSCGDTEPNGIVITEWKIDFGMNPDVELDADLCYADDWAGTNETVLDALDTTDGSASDDAVTLTVPAGKYLYVRMNADPEGTGDYLTFEFQYYKPED